MDGRRQREGGGGEKEGKATKACTQSWMGIAGVLAYYSLHQLLILSQVEDGKLDESKSSFHSLLSFPLTSSSPPAMVS